MCLAVSAMSFVNSGLALGDRACYSRKVSRVTFDKPPVFILGHWRSGTTFLHELLIRDPRHNYPTTYQCFVPHHFLLTEKLIAPCTEFLLPRRRPMDNMVAGWHRPQEDEFALQIMGVPSPYASMMFPKHGEVHREYLTLKELPEEHRTAWKRQLMQFFQRIALRDQRRLVVKSPPHTARLATLLEMFPDAKFIHITRHPAELFASTVRLWRSLNSVQGVHVPKDEAWVEDYVIDSFERMYEAFAEDRALLGNDQLAEVRYEDLAANPKAEVQRVYEELDLGGFDPAEPTIDAYLDQISNYRPNQHEIDESISQKLQQRWAWYYEEYGYELAASDRDSTARR
ncbi:Sulfotransferase domain protein [Adhaeretor mobilis]|uniref:Sulfotransferase domain protein n=2 Tax=Adhaeretor mobilis TaxID=1930276 RepID=A0A517MYS6_9BACT|nr:Sulfotransferase domain protein [Adhaeretor mobilis]